MGPFVDLSLVLHCNKCPNTKIQNSNESGIKEKIVLIREGLFNGFLRPCMVTDNFWIKM